MEQFWKIFLLLIVLLLLLFSRSVMYDSFQPHGLQHSRLPSPSLFPGVCSNSSPLNQSCHPTISSSVIPVSSFLRSFPSWESFPMNELLASDGQSIWASASASVLPVNTQGWVPLGWTGLISLLSKGLSRVFPTTAGQRHQFFGAQLKSTIWKMENNKCRWTCGKIKILVYCL